MTVIHADGYAHYCAPGADEATNTLAVLYTISGAGARVGTNYGVNGRYGFNHTGATGSVMLPLVRATPLVSTYSELWMGARIQVASGIFDINEFVCPFCVHGPLGGDSFGLNIRLYADGSVRLFRGNASGTQVGTATPPGWFPTGVKFYAEAHMKIHDSAGIIEFKANSQTHGFSGDTAQTTGETLISQVAQRKQLGSLDFSDYYIEDAQYRGDLEINVGLTTANGFDVTALTQVGGAASKWQSVNERPHDGDTTAVDLTAAGRGLFLFPPVGSVAPIAIAVHQIARKVGAGAATLKTKVRSGGSEASVGSHVLADTFASYEDVMMLNPVTIAAWAAGATVELGPERV